MKVETSRKSPVEVLLKIEVEPSRYEPILRKITREVSKGIQIPGFRKGKAPMGVILRRVGEDAIKEDLLKELIPDVVPEAIRNEEIIPLSTPQVTNYDKIVFRRGKPINLEIVAETKPEFELTGYKGLELTRKPSMIDVEEVLDKRIEALRQQAGEMIPIEEDRPLKKGDVAVVDFESFQEGEPVENGKSENYYMTVTDDNFIPGFADNLVGHKPGDEWEFDISFPDDYPNPSLAGRETHFKFKLHEIMRKELPDYDDDFAQLVGDYETYDEMKADLRKSIVNTINEQEKQYLQDQIINQLIEKMEGVTAPPVMVESSLNIFLDNLKYNLKAMNKDINTYFKEQGTTEEEVKRRFYPKGVEMAKAELALDKVAMLEDIKADDEEVDKEIEEMAKRLKQDADIIRKALEKEKQINSIKYSIRNRKVYDFLIEHAIIKEEETEEEVEIEESKEEIKDEGPEEVLEEKVVEEKPESEETAKAEKEEETTEKEPQSAVEEEGESEPETEEVEPEIEEVESSDTKKESE